VRRSNPALSIEQHRFERLVLIGETGQGLPDRGRGYADDSAVIGEAEKGATDMNHHWSENLFGRLSLSPCGSGFDSNETTSWPRSASRKG